MKIVPIEDGNSRFDLVYLNKDEIPNGKGILPITPHCKLHGAMNKVSSFKGGGFWRCICTVTEKLDNACRAACMQQN